MPVYSPFGRDFDFDTGAGHARQEQHGNNPPRPPAIDDSMYNDDNDPDGSKRQALRDKARWEGLRGSVNEGLQGERAAIDDWSKRFKDDYRRQMVTGVNTATGNLMNDAQARGFSGAMSRGAQGVGGQIRAAVPQAMEGINRQMDMEAAMAKYDQSQRAAQLEMAQQDLMNTYQGGQTSAAAAQRGIARGMDAAHESQQNQNMASGIGSVAAILAMLSDKRYKKVY